MARTARTAPAASATTAPAQTTVKETTVNTTTTPARMTIKSVSERVDSLADQMDSMHTLLETIVLRLTADEPAKVTRTPQTVAAAIEAVETKRPERTQCKGHTLQGEGPQCKRLSENDFCPSHKSQGAQAPKKAKGKKAQKAAAAQAVVKPAKKTTKGEKSRDALSRKEFNRALAAKARLAGGGTYRNTMANWAEAQAMGAAGSTIDQIVAKFTVKASA